MSKYTITLDGKVVFVAERCIALANVWESIKVNQQAIFAPGVYQFLSSGVVLEEYALKSIKKNDN